MGGREVINGAALWRADVHPAFPLGIFGTSDGLPILGKGNCRFLLRARTGIDGDGSGLSPAWCLIALQIEPVLQLWIVRKHGGGGHERKPGSGEAEFSRCFHWIASFFWFVFSTYSLHSSGESRLDGQWSKASLLLHGSAGLAVLLAVK
jgi:hypothetical protein